MGSAFVGAVVIFGVVVLVLWAIVAAVVIVMLRIMRRGYRAGRRRLQDLGASSASGIDMTALSAVTAATVASPGWWSCQRDQRRMWRTVSSAQHAVGVAKRSGAPVGDLPTVSRQLGTAARAVDAVLRASARHPGARAEASGEVARIEAAAADLHRAALDSLTMVSGAETDGVVSAARLELEALAEGLRAARLASKRYPV